MPRMLIVSGVVAVLGFAVALAMLGWALACSGQASEDAQ